MEELAPVQKEMPKKKIVENLSDKKSIPKKNTSENTLRLPEISLETDTQAKEEKKILESIEKQVDIPNLTPQEMEAQTQEVYESLRPDNYEETMEEAEIAFEVLDEAVEAMDTKLAEEMQDVEASQEEQMPQGESVEETMEEESQTEEDLPILENEEEIDPEQEDINNI